MFTAQEIDDPSIVFFLAPSYDVPKLLQNSSASEGGNSDSYN